MRLKYLPIAISLCTVALPASAERVLEEVIVTSQKREQTLKDVPSSVTALSSDFLDKTASKNFQDLGKIAAGLEIGGGSDGFGRSVRIRGVGTNKYVRAVSPSVGIFVDDIPLVDPGVAFTNLADVERIEVLKGPQSTLFGKGVSSGAIAIVSKKPTLDANAFYVETNIGNHGLQEHRLGGNVVASDALALRGALYWGKRDGEIRNLLDGKKGTSNNNNGASLRLMWQAVEDFRVVVAYQKHELEAENGDSLILSYGDYHRLMASRDPAIDLVEGRPFDRVTQDSSQIVRDTETDIVSLHSFWDINEQWSFASVTAQQEFSQGNARSRLRADNSGDTAIGPSVITPFNTRMDLESFSQELRFNFTGERLNSTIGVFYSDSEGQTVTSLANTVAAIPVLPEPLLRLAILSVFDQQTEEWAVFSNNTWSFSDRWDMTLGLRYTSVDKRDDSATLLGQGKFASLQSPFIPFVSNWSIPQQQSSWKVITGGLKFSYAVSDDASIYFGYDRGFKPGGHDTASHYMGDPSGNSAVVSPGFSEEYGDNIEVGIKGLFAERRISLSAALFHQVYRDYQVNIPDPITTFKTVNAAEVVVQGAELEFQWLLGEHMTLDGNIAYNDSRYDSYRNAGCDAPQFKALACTPDQSGNLVQDLSDKRLNLVAPWTANIDAAWNDTLANGWRWYIRGELAFRDDRLGTPDLDPATRMAAYTLVNASAGLRSPDSHWSLQLWGKNLTDKNYLTSIDSNSDGSIVTGYRATLGAQRAFGLTVRYEY
jgi:iron complex outermembrane receptor protein